ncbi:3542_t:CDS:2 [Diversispora eburnea]|uniref:3542_t:CDS:1 n=1 Tax=Diversispora eburnea TaxID=1213867 RepID=A0A9N8ZZX4_9GLOM|nr:3542_t:CDS:2 [Diversispora eburnea]
MEMNFIPYNQEENFIIPQDIVVKLPLRLQDDDLLAKPRRGKNPTRPPNTFLIYRTAYTRLLQSEGHYDLRMREVTSNAAKSWAKAAQDVKDECKKLATLAKKKHIEIYGPSPPRRRPNRRRRQNIHIQEPTPVNNVDPFPQPINTELELPFQYSL